LTTNFDRAFDIIISPDYESCRYTEDPKDPGGATKFGISQRAYPSEDIRNLTRERAAELYERDYWRKVRGDSVPFCLGFLLFDTAVNCGVNRSIKFLQGAVLVKQDGLFGDMTLNATMACPKHDIIKEYTNDRIHYYQSLKNFDIYGKGWTRRALSTMNICSNDVGK